MRTLFKYLLPTIVIILFTFFYLRYTESGQKNTYTLMSLYASHKAGIKIDIKDVNLNQFPYVRAKLLIEKLYKVDLDGFVKKGSLDLRYKLHSTCFKSDICSFDDIIDIQGKISGWKNDVHVSGQGKAIDGSVNYSFIKQKHRFKDVKLNLYDVNSSKLFSLLDQKAIFRGKANAKLDFEIIEKKHRVGSITYDVNDRSFYDINTTFHALVNVNDAQHTFTMDVNSSDITIHLSDGTYNQNKKYAHANYTLDVKDLSKLKKLLGGSYVGAFHATGEMKHDKHIKIKGVSTDLGGELHFIYDKHSIELFLKDLSFITLMKALNTKPILDANVTGHGMYHLAKKEMILKTKLSHAMLLPSSFTKSIDKKLNLNIEKEVFEKSHFELNLKEKVFSSNFTLANDSISLSLKDTKLNASRNAIDTFIDLTTPKHAIKGKLYARADTSGAKSLDDIYLTFDGKVEKHYKLKVDGLLSESFINMDYVLQAARLPSQVCTIVDDINLSGHVSGSFKRLHIVGAGTAMEGNVTYDGMKIKDTYEDVSIDFKNIHALKLFTLLGEPTFPNGKADVTAHFSYINDKKKKGHLTYTLHNGNYASLPLWLKASADIKNTQLNFVANGSLASTHIDISKGHYNFDTNRSKAFYTIKTKDLSSLKPLIGKFMGPFSSSGEITYDKQLQVRGLSSSYGGMIDFLYKKDMLYIDLEKVSLTLLMNLFPYPKVLDAQINGNINYDYKQEKLLIQTDINNTRFLNSDLVQNVFKKSGVNMLKENFPYSSLRATYQNKVLQGNIILKNKQSHFYLTNTIVDSKRDTVQALFDLKMQGQEFAGKIYGSPKHPKIDLNMKKLMRYQMDKQLDSVMGKGNRKLMESMPMEGVAKDMATEIGGGFLDMFF